MQPHRIAIIEGDGIGPDLIAQVDKIVNLLNSKYDSGIEIFRFPYGADYYIKTGISLPAEFVEQISKNYDVILLCPLGDPRIPDMKNAKDIILGFRHHLNLSMNVHPVKLYRSWLSSVKDTETKKTDFLIIRENMENYTALSENFINRGKDTELVLRSSIFTRKNVEQFIRGSFQYVKKQGRERICFIDRSALFPVSHQLWRSVIEEVLTEYPDIPVNYMQINTAINELINKLDEFDVIVTPNDCGDVLSTLSTVITGGFGLFFSIEMNPDLISLYRIMQSASSKLAGHNTANPLSAILAFRFILDELSLLTEAKVLEQAIRNNFENHWVTIDLGGIMGTEEVGDYICDFISRAA